MPGMQMINVSVVNNQVSVDRDPLDLRGMGPTITIQWLIATQGWTFPDDGIVIHDNDGQFHGGQAQQGTRYIWIDDNSGGKTYKYTVNVTNGSTPLTLDPSIINQ